MESKIGPTLQIIPEQRIYSCFGCKYHDNKMLRSGLNPVFDTSCLKMNIYAEVLEDKDVLSNVAPFILDNDSKTPSQCPYIKTEKRNNKISDLGIEDISDLFGNGWINLKVLSLETNIVHHHQCIIMFHILKDIIAISLAIPVVLKYLHLVKDSIK